MSKLALLILLVVAVSAFDPHREGHPRPGPSNTRQPHPQYTLPNGHSARPTIGRLDHHQRKDKPFQPRHPQSPQSRDWPSVKFFSGYGPELSEIARHRRQVHPRRQ